MIISLENISKYYNGVKVLDNISLTIEDNDRIGLIGVNGCGKSTLLKIITGAEFPEPQGEPITPKIHKGSTKARKHIGFLAQDSGLSANSLIIDEMRGVFSDLIDISNRLEEIRNNNLTEEFSDEYSAKTAFFELNDGYLIDVKIDRVLNGMGFLKKDYNRVISTLSGGERTRLALAKLLLEEPSLLILDEPTNHLDFDTILWLEGYLTDYKGALLIVSHDRYFLDKLTTSICEIEQGILRRFKGNYTAFTSQKEAFIETQLKEYNAQRDEIEKLKDYIARNIVRASTSNMAKSRMKSLEKIEANPIKKPITSKKDIRINLEYDREPPKELLSVEGVDLTVGNDKVLIPSISFEVRRGERLAIIGANGIGKSTLLKVIQKKHPHSRGKIRWGDNVKISYFEQMNEEVFDNNDQVINAVHRLYTRMTEFEVRSLLGSVGLVGENVYKKVGDISGGERAKLRFATMMLERGNVLILDEPTNHLDMATRDTLEEALCNYKGTIIFVSHDRYLLNKLATRVIEITRDNVHSYKGGFSEFIEGRNLTITAAEKTEKAENKTSAQVKTAYRSKEQRAKEARERVHIKNLEKEIERLELLVNELQKSMEDPKILSDHEVLNEKCSLYEQSKNQLSTYTDEWLELIEQQEGG